MLTIHYVIIAALAAMFVMPLIAVVVVGFGDYSEQSMPAAPEVDTVGHGLHRFGPVQSADLQGVADTEPGPDMDAVGHGMDTVRTGVDPVSPGRRRLIFDAVRKPKEHAAKVVERIRALGATGRAIHQGELEELHEAICEELKWDWIEWPAIGRELAKLPGVRKDRVRHEGRRLTVYEISATDTVVDLAEEKLRKRAAGPARV